jgi:hypothetical protein
LFFLYYFTFSGANGDGEVGREHMRCRNKSPPTSPSPLVCIVPEIAGRLVKIKEKEKGTPQYFEV